MAKDMETVEGNSRVVGNSETNVFAGERLAEKTAPQVRLIADR